MVVEGVHVAGLLGLGSSLCVLAVWGIAASRDVRATQEGYS